MNIFLCKNLVFDKILAFLRPHLHIQIFSPLFVLFFFVYASFTNVEILKINKKKKIKMKEKERVKIVHVNEV